MTDRDKEIVSEVRSCLSNRLGSERYELWFGSNIGLSHHNGCLKIAVDSSFRLDRLRNGLLGEIEHAVRDVMGSNAAKASPVAVHPSSHPRSSTALRQSTISPAKSFSPRSKRLRTLDFVMSVENGMPAI